MKKSLHVFSFICSIVFSTNALCGVLELTDPEKGQQHFSRILRNLENFYSVNAPHITTLNQENFFENPQNPSSKSRGALRAIKKNEDASIIRDYGKKLPKLKKHLKNLQTYFTELSTNEQSTEYSTILTYTTGLLFMLEPFDIK